MVCLFQREYIGAITPGFMIVTSMFYTRAEQTKRVGYWCMFLFLSLYAFTDVDLVLMNGFAIIFLGLVSFGLLHINVSDAFHSIINIWLFMVPVSPTISRHGNGNFIQIFWIHYDIKSYLQAHDYHRPHHPCDFGVILVRLMLFWFRINRINDFGTFILLGFSFQTLLLQRTF
jgi:hypothetical protein